MQRDQNCSLCAMMWCAKKESTFAASFSAVLCALARASTCCSLHCLLADSSSLVPGLKGDCSSSLCNVHCFKLPLAKQGITGQEQSAFLALL